MMCLKFVGDCELSPTPTTAELSPHVGVCLSGAAPMAVKMLRYMTPRASADESAYDSASDDERLTSGFTAMTVAKAAPL